jgi:hypothetical protein
MKEENMVITRYITLDVSRQGVQASIPITQHDAGTLRLLIQLRNGTTPIEPNEHMTAVLYIDTDVFDPVTIYTKDGAYPYYLEYNVSPMASKEAGEHKVVLKLYSGVDQIYASPEILFVVRRDLTNSTGLSSDKYSAVVQAKNDAENYANSAANSAKDAEEAATNAAENAVNEANARLQGYVDDAESAANSATAYAEGAYQAASEARESADKAQSQANDAYTHAQNAQESANSAAESAELLNNAVGTNGLTLLKSYTVTPNDGGFSFVYGTMHRKLLLIVTNSSRGSVGACYMTYVDGKVNESTRFPIMGSSGTIDGEAYYRTSNGWVSLVNTTGLSGATLTVKVYATGITV